MFRLLGVNFLAHAHPLHECSKYRKGVDQFDLYLASGLGASPDKIAKETKCETLIVLVLNSKKFSLSYSQSPFLHANTIWRYSSHGQRELLHPLFLCCFFQCQYRLLLLEETPNTEVFFPISYLYHRRCRLKIGAARRRYPSTLPEGGITS